MLLGGALGQFPLGGGPAGTATVVTIGWFMPLAEPVRSRPGLSAGKQQYLALQPAPSPFVATGWFAPLSEPKRFPARLPPAEQQFFAFQPAPSPFVATGWFAPLSEPVRQRPRSPAAMAPTFFIQPAPSPFVATGWFAPLSEPVRTKPGLKAALQQFLAAPSRLLPNPTITGILDATETKDVFLAGGSVFNRVTAAEIGVAATLNPAAQIGVAVPVAITSAKIAIL